MKLTHEEWAALIEVVREKWLAKEYTTKEYCEAMHQLCIDCKLYVVPHTITIDAGCGMPQYHAIEPE